MKLIEYLMRDFRHGFPLLAASLYRPPTPIVRRTFFQSAIGNERLFLNGLNNCSLPTNISPAVDYAFVQFIPSNIACVEYQSSMDAISADFSGCLMAKFSYRNRLYATHVYCYGSNPNSDCKLLWTNFLRYSGAELKIGFIPGEGLPLSVSVNGFVNTYMYWGVIDADNRCYSIQFTPLGNDTWQFAAIYEHESQAFRTFNPDSLYLRIKGLSEQRMKIEWSKYWQDPNSPPKKIFEPKETFVLKRQFFECRLENENNGCCII